MVDINEAKERFAQLLEGQRRRVAAMRAQGGFVDYAKLDTIVIGVCGGDGIGPVITHEAERVLRFLLKSDVERGRIVFKEIDGLTIENRAACGKAIPDDVLAELKACNVILKGPTTTPRAGDEWPNIESANVAMRKELDLFANVRPVKVPEQGIDWTFFRENTEGAYTLGSCGFETEDGISVDFTVTTTDGTQRIAELAYDFARKNHKSRVSIVTKANIVKATDGKFLKLCQAVGEKYPEITTDDWYIDIMTAKLVDEKRRRDFQVFVLPNLYGDIVSDLCAGLVGGLGMAPGSNIGADCAIFEATHGSAPDIAGQDIANPTAEILSAAMMLDHLGENDAANRIRAAVSATLDEGKQVTGDVCRAQTGSVEGAVGTQAFADAVIAHLA